MHCSKSRERFHRDSSLLYFARLCAREVSVTENETAAETGKAETVALGTVATAQLTVEISTASNSTQRPAIVPSPTIGGSTNTLAESRRRVPASTRLSSGGHSGSETADILLSFFLPRRDAPCRAENRPRSRPPSPDTSRFCIFTRDERLYAGVAQTRGKRRRHTQPVLPSSRPAAPVESVASLDSASAISDHGTPYTFDDDHPRPGRDEIVLRAGRPPALLNGESGLIC